MKFNGKKLFFYNAIPMPHSVLLQNRLIGAGYEANFWYYKGLTNLYPWSILESKIQYYIFKKNLHDFRMVFQQAAHSDLIIITGWHTYMHIYLILFAKITGRKFALWIDISQEKKTYYKTTRNKWLLRMATYLFVTGEVGFDLIHNEYGIKPDKMKDFPYLTAEFNSSKIIEINKERRALVTSNHPIKLLICNRFINRKGYSIIIEALKIVSSSILNQYEITILGNGPQYKFYEEEFKAINSRINLLGWVEYQEYLKYLQECDIFLHASIFEPFGIPPMDAMCCGKLVIGSTGVISCIDRISTGVNGFIYDKNNPKKLAEILELAANNRSVIYRIGDIAFETVKKYNPDYNIDCIESIL